MKKTSGKMAKGFAVMHPDQVHRICTMGGKAVCRKYGAKHMARIGRIGGKK